MPDVRYSNEPPETRPSGTGLGTRRALRMLAILILLVLLVGPMLRSARARQADPGGPAPSAGQGDAASPDTVPSSAWLLPFDDLREGEAVTWLIVLSSVVAMTLIVQAFLRVRRSVIMPVESTREIDELILQRRFTDLLNFTESDDSFVSRSLHHALRRAPNFAEMREGLETGVAEETSKQFRRLEIIHILANVGPLMGLLGTVLGIMDAFLAIRRAGGAAEVGNLAGGISMALGTTMLGLILAIMCLVSYGILRNKADQLTQEGSMLAEDLLRKIRSELGGKPSVAAAPAAAPTAARASAAPNRPRIAEPAPASLASEVAG